MRNRGGIPPRFFVFLHYYIIKLNIDNFAYTVLILATSLFAVTDYFIFLHLQTISNEF